MIQSKPELSDYYDGDLTKYAIEAKIKDHPTPMPPIQWIAILVSGVVGGGPFLYMSITDDYERILNFFLSFIAAGFIYTIIYFLLAAVWMFYLKKGEEHPFDPVKSPYIEKLKLALGSIESYEKDLQTYQNAKRAWNLHNSEIGEQYWLGLRGQNLENATASLLNRIGWECNTTAVTGDGGIDLIASKGSTEVLSQCKGHATKIGVGTIRDAAGVKSIQNKPFVVIAPIGFSQGSQEFADISGVKLLDVCDLIQIAEDAKWVMAENLLHHRDQSAD